MARVRLYDKKTGRYRKQKVRIVWNGRSQNRALSNFLRRR